MANRTLEVDCPQGLTLTAELFTPGADTVVASVALTERTNDKGCYTGTISGITGGLYRIRVKSGTTTIARGLLRHTDATGVERPDDVDGILSATHGTGQWDAVGSGGGGSTAADIWAYATRTLTQSAAQVAAAVSGSTVTLMRGDTISFSLTGLGSLAGRSKLWVTGKVSPNDKDAAAQFQIEETGGLLYIGGDVPGSASEDASLVVDDENAGDITITISAAASSRMKPLANGSYDVQVLISGVVSTKTTAVLNVVADVTTAV